MVPDGLASDHRYPQVQSNMAEMLPVLRMIHQDVQAKLAQPPVPAAQAPTLDLSLPGSAQ